MQKLSKLTMKLLLLLTMLSLTLPGTSAWANQELRVLIETENYHLTKFEPREGTYLGAYVIQDTLINADMSKFNQLTGKKHASFFMYVGYGRPFPEQWFNDLKAVDAVAHIAWEPNDGLEVVQDDAYLRSFARQLKDSDMPVFLRFASEMNGDWTRYNGDPEKYIEKWRLVHDVMAEEAPNVMMVWTVFTFPQETILKYYPGDEYVDWVGVNIYNVVYHNNNLKHRADHEDPLELLDYVYDTFSERKPIQISEYGATHFTITDNKEHVEFAIEKITRMYKGIKNKYPRVKSIFYFDVNNLINAPLNRRINNYALTTNQEILATYASLINDPHYLSEIAENREGEPNRELLNVKDPIHTINGTTYISSHAVRNYLGAQIVLKQEPKLLQITKNKYTFNIEVTNRPQPDAAFVKNGTSYLPLRVLASRLGYRLTWDPLEKMIKVTR